MCRNNIEDFLKSVNSEMLKMKIVYGVKRIGAYLCLEQDTKLIILLRFDVLAFLSVPSAVPNTREHIA